MNFKSINFCAIVSLFVFGSCTQSNETMEKLIDRKFLLAESPWWDAETETIAFIDIEGRAYFQYDFNTGELIEAKTTTQPGTIIPTTAGNFLIAEGNKIYTADKKGDTVNIIAKLDYSPDSLRFNDGKCAPNGTFWVGTVECQTYSKPFASLYSCTKDSTKKILNDITVSNGICWSPDGKTMYYIDSPTKKVKAFDYNNATSEISNERVIIHTPEDWGTPDGCCIDQDGNIWIAQWGGSCVALWNPENGEMIKKLDVPAKNVTAVALGGKDLDQLIITTASIAMEKHDEANYPDAGSIYMIKVSTPGMNQQKWMD